MTADAFSPDWVSPPGLTIADAFASQGLSLEDLPDVLKLSTAASEDLLAGKVAIDEALAVQLARTVGASPAFWLKREANYRRHVAQQPERQLRAEERSFVSQLPLSDMEKLGWLRAFSRESKTEAALAFFADADGDWRTTGRSLLEAVAFRTSYAHRSNPASVAAWLRQGALQAAELDCDAWDPVKLKAALPMLRALTRVKSPSKFFPKLVQICRSCGVAVVFVRTPKGCPASGATHFASPQKAVIQLSFRYRSDDHFWFTFFHEVGHLILHGDSALFVEGADYESGEQEEEANAFSAAVLIPREYEPELRQLSRRYKDVMRFARRIGISPGIVVGQMQKRALLEHHQLSFLKQRYDWTEIETSTL